MRVGLTFDLRKPPTDSSDWPSVYSVALDTIVEAERLGLDSAWASEHHFFEDGYLPQPLTFCAAAAARTSRIRLGTSIMIAPLRPAVQIAEELAVVDILSSGRVDLGLGPGYRVPEFAAFGANPRTRFSRTFDLVQELRSLYESGTVTPPPVQKLPPLWLGFRQAKGAYRTGVLGEGLHRVDPELLEPYVEGLVAGGHDPASARMVGAIGLIVADDPERAWPEIAPHLSYMWNSYHRKSVEGTDRPVPAPIDPERWRRSIAGKQPRFQVLTPDDAVAFIVDFVGKLPVVDLSVWATIAGMPRCLAERHVELLAREVAPRVRHLGAPGLR